MIELDGADAGVFDSGLNILAGGSDSSIKGLVVNSYQFSGMGLMEGSNNISISGNYIGVDPTGLIRKANFKQGIWASLDGNHENGPTNISIGGLDPEDRNIISGMGCSTCLDSQGIAAGGSHWTVQGNYIGVDANGTSAIGNNAAGMTIDYMDDLLIGGSATGATNVVSGNGQGGAGPEQGGLQPDYTNDVRIVGNYIGTDYTGLADLGNYNDGLSYGFNSTQGLAKDNIIRFNGDNGVEVFENSREIEITDNTIESNMGNGILLHNDGTGQVAIINNSIFDNGKSGIDLNGDGVTPNDPLDPDSGPNDLLNFPQWTDLSASGSDTTVTYKLDVPAGDYRIEFYDNDTFDLSGHGEGQTFIDSQNITSTGTGEQSFTKLLSTAGLTNVAMTATEIDPGTASAFGATSEFGGEAPRVSDVAVENSLQNPIDVAIGATLKYKYTFKNLGPDSVDLDFYDGSVMNPFETNMFVALVPFELNFIATSSTNPDIDCSLFPMDSNNPGAVGFLSNHPDHSLISCKYVGASASLNSNQSIDTTVSFVVDGSSDLKLTTNLVSGQPANDPDLQTMNDGFGGGTVGECTGYPDLLDCYDAKKINNYAKATYPDQDNDGIDNTIEDAGPNNGDANNDGTQDSLQPNVASYVSPVTGKRVVLAVSETCSIESSGVSTEGTNEAKDDTYSYPLGFMGFSLDCGDAGTTADVEQYFFDTEDEAYVLRKYDTNNNSYFDIDDSTVSKETIDNQEVIKASYQITDGGRLDMDTTANGKIVDPAGLGIKEAGTSNASASDMAINVAQTLANTGQAVQAVIVAALVLIAGAGFMSRRYLHKS